MQAIFNKIISWFMSLIFSILSFIPGAIEPVPISEATVTSNNSPYLLGADESWKVFSSYDEFSEFFEKASACEAKNYAETVEASVFEKSNIAVINSVHPDGGGSAHVTSAQEIGNSLEIKYVNVEQTSLGSTTALQSSIIFIETSKRVSLVNTEYSGELKIPFMLKSSFGNLMRIVGGAIPGCEAGNTLVFSDYESWKSFAASNRIGGNSNGMLTESFFNSYNLVVGVVWVPDTGSYIKVSSPIIAEGETELDYWCVREPGVHAQMVSCNTILIAAEKSVESITLSKNTFDIPFCLNGKIPNV